MIDAHIHLRGGRGGRPPAADQERDGDPRAAQLSLCRRDDGLRRGQPVRVHHGAARQGAERRDRQPADLRHRRHRGEPERARRPLQHRGVARRSASCSTSTSRPSPIWRRSARTSTAGARGRRSSSCPRICSRRSSATTTRKGVRVIIHIVERAQRDRSDLRRRRHAGASDHPGADERGVREDDGGQARADGVDADHRRELQPRRRPSRVPRSAALPRHDRGGGAADG